MAGFELGVLSNFPVESLEGDDDFCEALGNIQGEFLTIHPFREGNARTIKLMTDLISVQSGRPLLVYDATDKGIKDYITAAKAALLKANYRPMIEVIRRALSAARRE